MVTVATESRVHILAGSCHSFPQCRTHILRLIQYLKINLRTAHVAIYGKIWLSQLTNLPVAEKESLVSKLKDPGFREVKWQGERENILLFQSNFWSLELPHNQQEYKTGSSEKTYSKGNNNFNEITISQYLWYIHIHGGKVVTKEFLQLGFSHKWTHTV